MRVVFDTNIYVSALAILGGNAEDAYVEAVRARLELFTSVAILTETARVLQTKFDGTETESEKPFKTSVRPRLFSVPAPPSTSLKMNRTIGSWNVRSPHEQTTWSLEIRHLLALKRHAGITMVSLAEFLKTMPEYIRNRDSAKLRCCDGAFSDKDDEQQVSGESRGKTE